MPYGYEETRSWIYARRAGYAYGTVINETVAAQHQVDYAGFHQRPQGGNHVTAGPFYQRTARSVQYDVPQAIQTIGRVDHGENKGDINYNMVDYRSLRFLDTMIDIEPDYPDLDNCVAASITKSLNKLPQNAAQLGADLGESHQVINMFADTAKQVAQAILAGKSGNWTHIPEILGMTKESVLSGKFVANKWLEYQYGWKPLFGSLVQAQQKVHQILTKDTLISSRSGGQADKTKSWETELRSYKLSTTCSARTTLVARITRPDLASVNSWGLINPLSIAWELVPFSFVVDWVAPVGNTLSALTAGVGLEFVDGYTSVKKHFTYSCAGKVPNLSNTEFVHQSVVDYGGTGVSGTDFYRYPRFNFPTPQLYAVDNPFSTAHVANAAALLRQIL